MSSSNMCCTHQQLRIDSPEPPPRPLATIDGMFAATVLAEDHPHALKFPERKPETDSTIVQSPSITSKIKLHFTRKSVKNLKKGGEYDDDARQMTLQEVLDDIGPSPDPQSLEDKMVENHRFRSASELDHPELPLPEALSPDIRKSVLKSLSYLQPLLRKSSERRLSGESYELIDLATHAAARPALIDVSGGDAGSARVLPKSFSLPTLPIDNEPQPSSRTLRSRSEFDLCDSLAVPDQQIERDSEGGCKGGSGENASPQTIGDVEQSMGHVQIPTTLDGAGDSADLINSETTQHTLSDDEFHLHKMDISQQLRSMSQMSEEIDEEAQLYPAQSWSFHYRERSNVGVNCCRSRHQRQKSSSGVDSTAIPPCWGRVRSPVRTTSPSIYSRPVSPNAIANEENVKTDVAPLYEPKHDLNALLADWPLKPLTSAEPSDIAVDLASKPESTAQECSNTLPLTSVESHKNSGSASCLTSNENEEASSVRFLPLPRRPTSIPSKSSSSTLTKASKQSRFLERFSPPKRTVKKRLSVFKFLRPGSRKHQTRSISSPILAAKGSSFGANLDGQPEDPALLTVQYELAELRSHMSRSVSMGQLGQYSRDAGGHLVSHPALERRPTLADYERTLSVVGDDRRRPSTINVQRAKEIQEDDRRESVSVRRKLSRARALRDDASPLMAQALQKHQQEKALFRSPSKQRDSIKEAQPAPAFDPSPFSRTGSSLPPPSLVDYNDLLDPLERGQLVNRSQRGPDPGRLLSPPSQAPGPSRRTSPAASTKAPSTKTSITGTMLQPSPPERKRIGTSLESWSRYPSYTRTERCGSAGRPDAVLTRDFAVEINAGDIQDSDDAESGSPDKKMGRSVQHSKSSKPNTRSATFSGIVRYYSNLFHTRGWHGQNRRTSVTIGGRLEYPELEMLPPQMPTETTSSQKHSDVLKRFEDHIKKDADMVKHYLEEEGSKVEDYMKKEEDRLEGFVETEEHKLEDFVKKEESKLKDFVLDGEEKLTHPHHHHEPSGQSGHYSGSPFRTASIFVAPVHPTEDQPKRKETLVGPDEDAEQNPGVPQTADSRLALDGSGATQNESNKRIASKAEIWSELYKECLVRPVSRVTKEPDHIDAAWTKTERQAQSMPPPALRPAKPRNPEKPKRLDPKVTIRRFPSVTVLDDRKGHYRSISLLSIKTSKSASFERSSTHDLLELIKAREKEEREKLLEAVNKVGGHGAVDSAI